MALSSTKLKTLIDNKKWTDFQNITEEFHQSHHRHDITSLQKMTNLIAFIFGNEQSITVEELRKMSNSFVQAIESMIIAQIDETTSKKVLTSCFHVIKRLCKDVCTDGICHLMPIVIKFGKKYKSNVENEKCLEGFPYVIGSFAKKLAEKNVSTTDALLNIAIETCEEFNLKNDLFNLYKQKSHLHYEKTKNYEIALKSAEYMVHYHKDLQQLDSAVQCFGKFVKQLIETNVSAADALLKMAIETGKQFNLEKDLFNLYRLKYILHYEKTKNYELASESAEYMVHYHNNPQTLGPVVDCFVKAKRKLMNQKSNGLNPPLPCLDSTNVEAKKWEIIHYRPHKEFCNSRKILVEELLQEKQQLDIRDVILLNIELAWVCLSLNQDLSKGLDHCIEALNNVRVPEVGHDVEAYVQFWTGLLKWSVIKVKLKKEIISNKPKEDHQMNQDGANPGDPSSNYLCKVFNQSDFHDVLRHFESCENLIEEQQQKPKKSDKVIVSCDLIPQNHWNSMSDVLDEIFYLIKSHKRHPKETLDSVWLLIDQGHNEHAKNILEHYDKSPEIEENSIDGCLLKAEVKLLKSHLMLNCNGNFCSDKEGPLESLWNSVKSSQRVTAAFKDYKLVSMENIHSMFKSYNLASKSRILIIKALMSAGLGKEMKLYAKMNTETALEACLLPNICAQMLVSVEVDLVCDDDKQAQAKLMDIENLLKDDLRSDPAKIKTNPQKKSEKILLPIDDPELLCASPNMIKMFFGLPNWMQKMKDYNEKFDLYYEIVLKYFTFQGVVWFLEQDTQAMNTYFRLVEKAIGMVNIDKPLETILTCLHWMIECYAQLEQYDRCLLMCSKFKSKLMHTQFRLPYWRQYYKDTIVSLSKAAKKKEMVNDPSPVSPSRSSRYIDVQTPNLDVTEKAKKKLPKIKPKPKIPVNFEADIKKLSELKIEDVKSDSEEIYTPLKPIKISSKNTPSHFKTPRSKSKLVDQRSVSLASGTRSRRGAVESTPRDDFKTPISKPPPLRSSSLSTIKRPDRTPIMKIYEDKGNDEKPVRRSARK